MLLCNVLFSEQFPFTVRYQQGLLHCANRESSPSCALGRYVIILSSNDKTVVFLTACVLLQRLLQPLV